MTYQGALKWAIVPAVVLVLLVGGNAAYYYIDQPDRWRNWFILIGLVGVATMYAASFLCCGAVITLVNLMRKSPAGA